MTLDGHVTRQDRSARVPVFVRVAAIILMLIGMSLMWVFYRVGTSYPDYASGHVYPLALGRFSAASYVSFSQAIAIYAALGVSAALGLLSFAISKLRAANNR
jgi:hypothetical protein